MLCHDKIINVKAEEGYEGSLIDEVDGIKIKVETMSRVTLLSKAVLYLLNGAEVQGLGQLQFNAERSRYNLAQYGLWNKRNFEGMKIVISGMICNRPPQRSAAYPPAGGRSAGNTQTVPRSGAAPWLLPFSRRDFYKRNPT